jgi:hypothetical protein
MQWSRFLPDIGDFIGPVLLKLGFAVRATEPPRERARVGVQYKRSLAASSSLLYGPAEPSRHDP